MKITDEGREQMERSLPPARVARERLQKYLELTGMSVSEFAHACGRSYNTISYFAKGSYSTIAQSDLLVRRDVVEFLDAHPVEPDTVATGELHKTRNYEIIRRLFYNALNYRRGYCCQGDPGTQKTFVAKHLIAELNRNEIHKNGTGRRAYYVRCRVNMRPLQLLRAIARAAGVSPIGETDRTIRALAFAFGTRPTVIVLDEAQRLSVACFEEVRDLLDEPPHAGLLFLGSHELQRIFVTGGDAALQRRVGVRTLLADFSQAVKTEGGVLALAVTARVFS